MYGLLLILACDVDAGDLVGNFLGDLVLDLLGDLLFTLVGFTTMVDILLECEWSQLINILMWLLLL